ncbi:MAG: hypothetical protein O8C55_13140 [Candidatus Methanoperedens sp.]|nr:hypothetical protein [Candidatus Methanoperedens sp.]
MVKSKIKSIPGIILLRIAGLLLFISFIYIAGFLSFFTDNPVNNQVIQFLNENIGLIVLMSITFLFGEIFSALSFPLNLPAPLFNASAAVLLVTFIFRIFGLIDTLLNKNILRIFDRIELLVYSAVFIIMLIGGYMMIFHEIFKNRSASGERDSP